MSISEVLYHFWSGFSLPAYDENTVPDNAQMPYLTYETSDDFFGSDRSLSVSLWYRSTSWVDISDKEQEIAEHIGRGGRMLAVDNGGVWIKRGSPWAQRMLETADRSVRHMVLNYEIEFLK